MITGYHTYRGMTAQQHVDAEKHFRTLFKNKQPKRILEIGTSFGGFTLLIRDILNEIELNNTLVRTYDINKPQYLDLFINEGSKIEFIQKNVFSFDYSSLVEVSEIVDFIQSEGITIVLCDGGSKKNEFRILSEYLKPGDIIMAHDYSPNREYFEENINGKIWNWLEIQDSDISESCSKYNLSSYMSEDFLNIVWCCKEKI